MKNRSKNNIIVAILESVRSGSTKTKVMFEGYLSYRQTVDYLKFLKEAGLLLYEDTTKLYRLTEKGLNFLNKSLELNELIPLSRDKGYRA